MQLIYVDDKELGTCPAAVTMGGQEPIIEINKVVWKNYTPYQQQFIIAHELGHWELDTDSEIEADRYAIRKVAGTAPRSLKNALLTLYKLGCIPYERMKALYDECLKIDQERNTNTIEPMKTKHRINFNGTDTMRADGNEGIDNAIPQADTPIVAPGILQSLTPQKAGFSVKGVFINLESVLLAAILISILYIIRKSQY